MEMSITFNTAENKLVVSYDDGTNYEYTEATKSQYLADYPDRMADVAAMGWSMP